MKLAAFGRTDLLYASIRACAAHGHQIVLIGTCPAAPEYAVAESDFAQLAAEYGCAFFCDPAINRPEYLEMVKASGAEAAISVNWLTLIGQTLLDQFRLGILNAHAGDLPRYRGNACPNWAILMGEPEVVVTIHQMVPELDAGPIILQRKCALTPSTYIADFYRWAGQNIPEMFVEALDGLISGSIVPRQQPAAQELSLRTFPRLPRDGFLDWVRPAVELARLVRASAEPFAGAYSFIGWEKLTVWRAYADALPYPYCGAPGQVAERRPETGDVSVICGEGVLVLQELETQLAGRRPATEIIKSSRARLGMDIPSSIAELLQRVSELERRLPKAP
jgi:UDP-4-amino-4-deoxy-L-arabinose formyltransferase/UDP-glucuronic acid dehydrogenase (UDP-4-keto-hexauronic acid decarboxylating)